MRAPTFAALVLLASCAPRAARPSPAAENDRALDGVARAYVGLALAVGEHDPNYVDAYYGPEEWRAEAKREKRSLPDIEKRAEDLLRDPVLFKAAVDGARDKPHSPGELRARYLYQQLEALAAYVEILQGRKLSFDEESKALYDAVAPRLSQAELDSALAELDALLPGPEPLWARYDAFRSRFQIPADKIDAVLRAAIDGCKARTVARIALPAGESFTLEYVRDKPWGAYNWYQGGYRSVIQVNQDMPGFVDRAVGLGCHEGYPGHHVYNVLLEQRLARGRGWVEYEVYPLYSPQSLVAEGSAQYGIRLAFPTRAERAAFAKEKLFPLAGLDPAQADRFYEVVEAAKRLDSALIEAARGRVDQGWDAERTKEFLMRYALASPQRAEHAVRGIDQYRSYLINYALGEDIVGRYVEEVGGPSPEGRWKAFADLLASPLLPSDLEVQHAAR